MEMKHLPKVAVSTLNWNNYETTVECLESLLNQDYPCFSIFVLENGSDDGSAEKLREWGKARLGKDFLSLTAEEAEKAEGQALNKRFILIEADENLGFAGGHNFIIPIAQKTGVQYVWCINNDTIQDRNSLRALVDVAQSASRIGMVCSRVLYYNKKNVVESMGSTLIIPLGVFRHIGQGLKNSGILATSMEIPYVYGCSFLVDVALINDIGLMDERYFLLREESDWSIRARRKGWKICTATDSIVWHKASSSIGKRSDTFFYYVTRNTLLFMRKHYPLFLPLTILFQLPLVTGVIFMDSLFSRRKRLLRRLKMAALGYIHFARGAFGRLKVRN